MKTLAIFAILGLSSAPAMAQDLFQTADGQMTPGLTAGDILSNPDLLTPVIAGLTANPGLHRLHAAAVAEGRFAGNIVDFAYAWVAVNGVFAAPPAEPASLCDDPMREPAMMIYCGP